MPHENTFSCQAPGKIMLAGEYAVVDGGPALLMAVNRVATATLSSHKEKLSPFLLAALRTVSDHFGAQSIQAKRARRVAVCTNSFRHQNKKFGLGSSAAATVSAIGLSISINNQTIDQTLVQRLASKAHADAQATMGARGSGADIACASFGGIMSYQSDPKHHEGVSIAQQLPKDLFLVFPWTEIPAATAPMVSAVQQFKERQGHRYVRLADAISVAAQSLADASNGEDAVVAIGQAGQAARSLGEAAEVPIWLEIHSKIARIAARLGGSVKPTGAGGGDLAMAAFSNLQSAKSFAESLKKEGIFCPDLGVDPEGVRLCPSLP